MDKGSNEFFQRSLDCETMILFSLALVLNVLSDSGTLFDTVAYCDILSEFLM